MKLRGGRALRQWPALRARFHRREEPAEEARACPLAEKWPLVRLVWAALGVLADSRPLIMTDAATGVPTSPRLKDTVDRAGRAYSEPRASAARRTPRTPPISRSLDAVCRSGGPHRRGANPSHV